MRNGKIVPRATTESRVNRLAKWLLLGLFVLSQTPLMPIFALAAARLDGGHQVQAVECSGQTCVILHHDQGIHKHAWYLVCLLTLENSNRNSEQDHVLSFGHSSQLSVDNDRFVASNTAVRDLPDFFYCSDDSLLPHDPGSPVHALRASARIQEPAGLPDGLRSTVLLI